MSPSAVPVAASVPAGSSIASRAPRCHAGAAAGREAGYSATTRPAASSEDDVQRKRMPSMWTARQGGSSSPSPGGRPVRPSNPRSRGHHRSATPIRVPSAVPRSRFRTATRRTATSTASVRMIWMSAGPRITTNIAGKMKSTSGNTSLMVVFAAASSARCRRLVRMVSACTRSAWAIEVPNRSVWISMATSDLTSSSPVRSPRFRSASSRAVPARISRFTRLSCSPSTRLTGRSPRATRTSAWLSPSPASTQTTIMSSASGSAFCISFCRLRPAREPRTRRHLAQHRRPRVTQTRPIAPWVKNGPIGARGRSCRSATSAAHPRTAGPRSRRGTRLDQHLLEGADVSRRPAPDLSPRASRISRSARPDPAGAGARRPRCRRDRRPEARPVARATARERPARSGSTKSTRNATEMATNTDRETAWRALSDLDVDDLTDPQISDDLHAPPRGQA